MKYQGRKTIIQKHSVLAARLQSMADSFYSRYAQMTDEQKKAVRDLEEQALEHRRKASFNKDVFTMIL